MKLDHSKLRRFSVRHLDHHFSFWLMFFLALVTAKLLGIAKNPWGIVLAPLWMPPVVLGVYQLVRLLRWVIVLVIVLLLGW